MLSKKGLKPGEFIISAAAGIAHVPIKAWPHDRFASIASWLYEKHGRRTLLIGSKSERDYLGKISKKAGRKASEVWLGSDDDLPLLTALIFRSRLFLGNDTGPMHLAAAIGRPLVAIFGGGTWPRFKPAGKQALSLCNPLPCFGCGWDCPLGDAPCIRAVGVRDVRAAVEHVLGLARAPFNEVRFIKAIPRTEANAIGKAAVRAWERNRIRIEREQELVRAEFLAKQKDKEVAALQEELVRIKKDR